MTDVFISYAREDAGQAERIARGLEAMGLSVFWDNEIPPGQTWADYIETKLNQCAAAIVLWSANSTKSQWVREEARMGRAKLIPARLDASEAPFGFGDVQAADLSQWDGDLNHPQWTRFANAVVARARGAGAPSAPPSPQPQASGWQTPPPSQQQSGWSNQGAQAGAGGELSPIAYVRKCLRLYIDGKGRARRREFWWWFAFRFGVAVVAILIDLMFGYNQYTMQPNSQVVTIITGLALLPPTVAVASRRLHDAGQNGWIAAAPIVLFVIGGMLGAIGGLFSLLGLAAMIVIGVLPGNPGSNQYGPDPKAAAGV